MTMIQIATFQRDIVIPWPLLMAEILAILEEDKAVEEGMAHYITMSCV